MSQPKNINNKPKRIGIAWMPQVFGLSLLLSWSGTWYEDYSYQRKIKYLDIRGVFLVWSFWIQIPIKKYGIAGVVK